MRFFAVTLLPLMAGLAVTLRLRRPYFLGERLLLGLTLGVVSMTMLTFVSSLAFGFRAFTVWSVFILVTAGAALTFAPDKLHLLASLRQRLSPPVRFPQQISKTDLYGLAVFLAAIAFFSIFATRLVIWQDEALATGILDNWGDLPFHLGVITSLLNGGEIPPLNHTFANHPLFYPFLADFFSAMLMLTGIPLEHAIELPAVLMNSVAMTLLFYVGYRLVRHRPAAALAPALFVLAGGLGFLWFLSDIYYANKPVWDILQHLPRRYTNIGDLNIHWVNPTLAHLLPQRSYLFGMPLALAIAIVWWSQKDQKNGNAWLPGIFAGLLPLSHTHTFLAIMMASAMMAVISLLRKQERRSVLRYWTTFYAATFAVAAPQLVYLLGAKEFSAGGMIRFAPGWMTGSENLICFWLKNTGVLLPLLLAALFLAKRLGLRKRALWFYLPFGMLWVICNFFLFSRMPYDTNKIFVFAFFLAMPFVAVVMAALFQSKSWWLHGFLFRLLLVALVFSGSLNLIHELQSGGWEELSAEEIDLAKRVRKETFNHAVFLTAPIHNNFLTLAGRQVVLGYPGHIMSHGLNHAPAEQAVQDIYSGNESAEEKLKQYGVNYIVVGPHERSKYGQAVDWLQKRFPEFMRSQNYVIYKHDGGHL